MNFTDDEIRIKVAEAMGARLWNNPTQSGPSQLWGFQAPSPGEVFARMWLCGEADCLLPDYPEDLNACAEFEAKLTDEEKASYVMRLNASHPTSDIFYPDQSERGFNNKLAREVFGLVSATARQRCLAFLKTKGLIP